MASAHVACGALGMGEDATVLAAGYFATFLSIFAGFLFPLLVGSPASVAFKLLVGLVTWLVVATLSVVGLKRGWGERLDAEAYPPPTARRIWSRASDRFLLWWMWLGVGATVGVAIGLLTGTDRSWAAVLAVPCGAWLATSTGRSVGVAEKDSDPVSRRQDVHTPGVRGRS